MSTGEICVCLLAPVSLSAAIQIVFRRRKRITRAGYIPTAALLLLLQLATGSFEAWAPTAASRSGAVTDPTGAALRDLMVLLAIPAVPWIGWRWLVHPLSGRAAVRIGVAWRESATLRLESSYIIAD